jgi:tRNA U38,U39,U40 pseudouridine synthase TruA
MSLALFLAAAIRRTTGGFDSKNSVDSRIYEYLLPGYILAPEEPKPQRTRRSSTCVQLPRLLFLLTLSPDVYSMCAATEEGEAAAAEAAGALTQALIRC